MPRARGDSLFARSVEAVVGGKRREADTSSILCEELTSLGKSLGLQHRAHVVALSRTGRAAHVP